MLFLLGVSIGWVLYGLCNVLLQSRNKSVQGDFDFSKRRGRLLNLLLPIAEPLALAAPQPRDPEADRAVVQAMANDERRLRSQSEGMQRAAIRPVPPGIKAIDIDEELRRERELYRRSGFHSAK